MGSHVLIALALTSGLLTTANAQVWRSGFPGFAGSFLNPPFSAYGTYWDSIVAASNASATFRIPGYDVSKAWPSTSQDGWEMSITAIDMPYPSESRRRIFPDFPGRWIGSAITVKAPDSMLRPSTNESDSGKLVVDVNEDEWGFCFWRSYAPSYTNMTDREIRGKGKTREDGGCDDFLPKDCIDALEKDSSTSYAVMSSRVGPYGTRSVCYDIDLPDACRTGGDLDFTPILTSYGVPLRYLNGTTTELTGWETDENTTAQNMKDIYDTAVGSYYAVLTLFTHIGNASAPTDPGFARLSCIRADGTGTGKSVTGGGGGADGDAGDAGKGSGVGSARPWEASWQTLAVTIHVMLGLLVYM